MSGLAQLTGVAALIGCTTTWAAVHPVPDGGVPGALAVPPLIGLDEAFPVEEPWVMPRRKTPEERARSTGRALELSEPPAPEPDSPPDSEPPPLERPSREADVTETPQRRPLPARAAPAPREDDSDRAKPEADSRPAATRWGPIICLGVTAAPLPGRSEIRAAASAALGARVSLRTPDPDSDFHPTAAVLLGFDQLGAASELTLGGRLELLGSSGGELLLPYFYGYLFAATGLATGAPSGPVGRAGVGMGWNVLAGNRLPRFTPGKYGIDGAIGWVLAMVPARVEAYYQLAYLGSQQVSGARVGLGFAL